MIKMLPLPTGVTTAIGQGTAAMQDVLAGSGGRGRRTPRRRGKKPRKGKAKSTKRRKKSRTVKGRKKRAKLVKGSAAAKAWGRKMKKLRKR